MGVFFMPIMEDNQQGNLKHYDIAEYVGKKEIVSDVSALTGFRKADVSSIYDAIWLAISNTLSNDKGINIDKFGKFYPATLPERKRWDGKNKRYYIVPPHQSIKFKFDRIVKRKINEAFQVKRGLGVYAYIPAGKNPFYDFVFGKAPDEEKYGASSFRQK
jgi:nucleoid DNA-binding protein